MGINPPGFGWWRAKGASSYRLIVRGPANYEAAGLTESAKPHGHAEAGSHEETSDISG